MIRAWPENETVIRNPPCNRGYFARLARALCIENYNMSRPILHSNIHQVLHLPQKVTLEPHQVLHLPHKMTLMTDLRHIWNVIYNARSNRCHSMTWLCDLTLLLVDSTITWLYYYLTLLWLHFMIWLLYDLTLWLDSTMTWLCDLVRISVVSHLNFLWEVNGWRTHFNYYAVYIFMGTYTTYTYVVQK